MRRKTNIEHDCFMGLLSKENWLVSWLIGAGKYRSVQWLMLASRKQDLNFESSVTSHMARLGILISFLEVGMIR